MQTTLKFLRKSDWGEYWLTTPNLTEDRLKQLSFDLVAKLGVRVDPRGDLIEASDFVAEATYHHRPSITKYLDQR